MGTRTTQDAAIGTGCVKAGLVRDQDPSLYQRIRLFPIRFRPSPEACCYPFTWEADHLEVDLVLAQTDQARGYGS